MAFDDAPAEERARCDARDSEEVGDGVDVLLEGFWVLDELTLKEDKEEGRRELGRAANDEGSGLRGLRTKVGGDEGGS